MLIPQFKITQDDDFIIISIRLPYVKVTACQFFIQEKIFKFYLKPYLLSLNFEQSLKLVEQPAKAVYNYDKHILTVYVQKQNKKQFFQNLNLLSNILMNKKSQKTQKKQQKKVLIQVMDEKGQKVIQTQQKQQTRNQFGYGFCGNYYNVFKNLQQQVLQLFAFDPKDVNINQRYELQRKITYEEFDENCYMYDKMSNFEQIDRIVQSNQATQALHKLIKQFVSPTQSLDSEKFRSQLKIPNKQIMIPKGQHPHIWKQLFSIIFSYIYELVCMQGDFGVESQKTINKTSAVFSANLLYRNQSFNQVVYDCSRRCVTYSLYKHVDICQKVINIIRKQLSLQLLLVILSDIKCMFQRSEPRYLLNTIYLNDYCIYLMNGTSQDKEVHIKQILKNIQTIKLTQQNLDLDIQGDEEDMSSMLCSENPIVQSLNEDKQVNQNDDLEVLLDLD